MSTAGSPPCGCSRCRSWRCRSRRRRTIPTAMRRGRGAVAFVFAAGAIVLWLVRGPERGGRALDVAALTFDFVLISAFALVFHFERGTPSRQLLFLPVLEGAARFALPGAFLVAVASAPVVAWFEYLRSGRF